MKFSTYLMAGLLVAGVGIGVVGCNTNDVAGPAAPSPPSSLRAVSLSNNSVGLKWDASLDGGVTYLVTYAGQGAVADSGSIPGVSAQFYDVGGLQAVPYTFYVYAVKDSVLSNPVTVEWAPATRFDYANGGQTDPIDVYEKAALPPLPSGLILFDPAKSGPNAVSLAQSSTTDFGAVNIAVDVDADSLYIGPAYAMTQYARHADFDSTTYMSTDLWNAASLDDFYLNESLENYIVPGGLGAGNVRAAGIPLVRPDSVKHLGVVFIAREGNGLNRHYARVFIEPDASGNLVRGSAGSRYVRLHISYQGTQQVPYAKRVAHVPAYHSWVWYPLKERPDYSLR